METTSMSTEKAHRNELLRAQLATAAAQIDAGLGISLDEARKQVDRRIQQCIGTTSQQEGAETV